MHLCFTLIPAHLKDSNISRIKRATKKDLILRLAIPIIQMILVSAILACSKGVTLFEKHFTYDKNEPGF